jgi:hypothetical protein
MAIKANWLVLAMRLLAKNPIVLIGSTIALRNTIAPIVLDTSTHATKKKQ